jgi:MFS family permease
MSARSMGFNISHPAFQALRADVVPPRVRGRVFGLFGAAFTAGDVVGPIVSTWLYDLYRFQTFDVAGVAVPGLGIPFFINAILGVIGTTMVMLFVREPKPEERSRRIDIEPTEA